jgi:hypothetical protein
MAYTAQTLITRSWYLSGIVARNLQVVTGDQITDGLMLLNALLDFKQIETDLIPYYTYLEMPLVGGQEYYFMPNVAEIELATFNIDVVRYPMDQTGRRAYFGSSRVDNIQTLPFNWNFNRGEGGGTLGVYFLPQANYPLKVMAKLFLNDVTLQTDLTNVLSSLGQGFVQNIVVTNPGLNYTSIPTVTVSGGGGTGVEAYAVIRGGGIAAINLVNAGGNFVSTPSVTITGGGGSGAVAQAYVSNYNFIQTNNAGYDSSYLEYMRYALANYMCSEYGILFNPESQKIYDSMRRKLMYMSPPDLHLQKISILTESTGYNYGDINIGRGWRPN